MPNQGCPRHPLPTCRPSYLVTLVGLVSLAVQQKGQKMWRGSSLHMSLGLSVAPVDHPGLQGAASPTFPVGGSFATLTPPKFKPQLKMGRILLSSWSRHKCTWGCRSLVIATACHTQHPDSQLQTVMPLRPRTAHPDNSVKETSFPQV